MVTVRQYTGTVPASGKQVFVFGTEKFCHRSVAKDKSDYLVRVKDKAILRAYPIKTDRMVVIEDLAKNISQLSQEYLLVEDEQVVGKKDIVVSESCNGISMTHFSDGSVVHPRCIEKKSYNLNVRGEW